MFILKPNYVSLKLSTVCLGEYSNTQGRKWELSPLKSQWEAEEIQDWKKNCANSCDYVMHDEEIRN